MTDFKRILLATDFSESSTYAARQAVLMARAFQAELHVLHVLATDLPDVIDSSGSLPPSYCDYLHELEKHVALKLESVIGQDDRDQVSLTLVVRRGSPSVQILRYAVELQVDLIVLGTHGRGALAHVLMGNVAEKVVRLASCPVLTVRHPHHAEAEANRAAWNGKSA